MAEPFLSERLGRSGTTRPFRRDRAVRDGCGYSNTAIRERLTPFHGRGLNEARRRARRETTSLDGRRAQDDGRVR